MFIYTLHEKKGNFDLSIFPDAPGSLTLTQFLDDFVKQCVIPGSLACTLPQNKYNFKKVVFLLGKSVFTLNNAVSTSK